MNPDRFRTALDDLILSKLADVHTAVPARLSAVDYGSGMASAVPLVKTVIGVNKSVAYPELTNIPLFIPSGNSGKAKITLPVKSGDRVLVLFSERDPSNFINSKSEEPSNPGQTNYLGLFPIGILPCLGGTSVDSENIIVENEKSTITAKPDGTILMENDAFHGEAKPDGNFVINGLTITTDGNIITKEGVNLNQFYATFLTHVHSGVTSGGSRTGGPVGV